MAAELMLINPRRKRRGKHRRKSRVIHARRNPRRRRKMSALQMQYFGKGRKRRHGGRRRHRRASIVAMTKNPIRRRRHRRRAFTIMRRNPRDFASNPVGFVEDTVVPATFGALGGVAANWIFSNYAPASLQVGLAQPISQLALAALLGAAVGGVTDEQTGAMVGAGAMTVTIYEMIENYLSTGQLYNQNSYGVGPYGNIYAGNPYGYRMGRFVRMGRIMNGRMGKIKGVGRILSGRMGYINPARQMGC